MSFFKRRRPVEVLPVSTQRQRFLAKQAAASVDLEPFDFLDFLDEQSPVPLDHPGLKFDPYTGERVRRAVRRLPADVGSPQDQTVHAGRLTTRITPDGTEQRRERRWRALPDLPRDTDPSWSPFGPWEG